MNLALLRRLPTAPAYIRVPGYLVNNYAHFAVDVLNSTVVILVAVLSAPLGLNNATIGLVVTAHTFGSSLTQPLFGWLSDRYSARAVGVAGILWLAGFYALAALSTGWWSITFLVISALGSAAYHPQGAMVAGRVPRRYAATATALFFLFGQMGLGLGPGLAGAMLQGWGRSSLLALSFINLLAALWLWRSGQAPAAPPPAAAAGDGETRAQAILRPHVLALVLFGFLLFSRMTLQAATTTFLPKHLLDLGWAPASFGLVVSVLMAGSAVGNIMGGSLADRMGWRKVVAGSLFLAAPAFWFYLMLDGAAFYLLLLLAGLLSGAGHSVLVVMAQAMLPSRQALASGLTLGFMFASGAVGAAIAGWLGDHIGLGPVLQGMAVVSIAAALSALGLPALSGARKPSH